MTDSRQQWEERYRSGRLGWDRGGSSPALVAWLAAGEIPVGRILVPGCGHGHEVADLVHAGCQVTAVDIAALPVMRLMGELADQGLHANVVQADLLAWQPREPFDAVYEQTCLCALDPSQWSAYARRLHDWLVPGGGLFALFMQTGRAGGPPYDCPIPTMEALFETSLWAWPDTPPHEVPHPNGMVEHAVVLTRR
jgi:methyl halide transferase